MRIVLLLVAAIIAGMAGGRTAADFSSTTANSGNSFSAAATFGAATFATGALVDAYADSALYAATVLTDNPRGYWRLGEPAGTTTATDASGNGLHGTYPTGSVSPQGHVGATGDSDTAMRVDENTSGSLEMPHHTDFNLPASYSIEMWIKRNAVVPPATSRTLVGKGTIQTGGWRLQLLTTGALNLSASGSTSTGPITFPSTAIGWTHLVITHDVPSGSSRWYVGGAHVYSSARPALTADTGPMTFFGGAAPAGDVVHLDEPAIYAHALSAGRVREHWRVGRMLKADPCATYRVVANVTDLGSPPTGVSSVTADVSGITPGATAVPLSVGSWNVGGTTYQYRSGPLRAAVTPGAYPYTLTSVDGAGTHTQSDLAASVDEPSYLEATWLTGFEHGTIQTPNLFSANFGGVATTTQARTGTYSLQVAKTSGGSVYTAKNGFTPTTALAFAVRLASLPTGDVTSLAALNTSTTPLYLGYQAATGKLTLRWGANAPVTGSTAITAGTWSVIELMADVSSNPNTAAWRINEIDQTEVSAAVAAQTVTDFRFGSAIATDVFTAHYDDIVHATSRADHPVGPLRVRPGRPNGTGTHAFPERFQHEDGSAISASTPLRLDDDPMTGILDGVKEVTVSSSAVPAYLELTVPDIATTCVRGVQAVVAQHKAASAPNDSTTSVSRAGSEQVVATGDSGDVGVITHRTVVITPRTVPWTAQRFNELVFRIGYATDVNPTPFWDALLLEYASPS